MESVWNFDLTNQVIPAQGSGVACVQRLLRTLKDSLLEVPGASVVGSQNSLLIDVGMDGVDRWTTDADLVWSTNNERSWIVLQFDNISGGQLLIELGRDFIVGSDPDFDPSRLQTRIWWSASGLFEYAGDDSRYDPPTATDAQVLTVIELNADDAFPDDERPLANEPLDNSPAVLHVLYTEGGTQIRAVAFRYTNPSYGYTPDYQTHLLLSIGRVTSPTTEWDGPHTTMCVGGFNVFGPPVLTTDSLNYSNRHHVYQDSEETEYQALLSGDLIGASATPYVPNVFTGRYTLVPMNLRLAYESDGTTVVQGLVGSISDMYWGTRDPNTGIGAVGTRYTLANGDKFIQIDHVALPWNDSDIYLDPSGLTTPTDVLGEAPCPCAGTVAAVTRTPRPDPIPQPVPVTPEDPEYVDHAAGAISRLCEFLKAKSS